MIMSLCCIALSSLTAASRYYSLYWRLCYCLALRAHLSCFVGAHSVGRPLSSAFWLPETDRWQASCRYDTQQRMIYGSLTKSRARKSCSIGLHARTHTATHAHKHGHQNGQFFLSLSHCYCSATTDKTCQMGSRAIESQSLTRQVRLVLWYFWHFGSPNIAVCWSLNEHSPHRAPLIAACSRGQTFSGSAVCRSFL